MKMIGFWFRRDISVQEPACAARQLRPVVSAGILLLVLFARTYAFGESYTQVFSHVSHSEASVGETILWEVECWSTTDDPEAVQQSFEGGKVHLENGIFRVDRAEKYKDWKIVNMMPVLHLRWRFYLKAQRKGSWASPAFSFRVDSTEFRTARRPVEIYQVSDQFVVAQRSVLPIVVFTQSSTEGGQPVRLGSAFPVADDALVTSYHAIAKAERIEIRLPDGRKVITRKAWVIDPERDIALLHVPARVLRRARVSPLNLVPVNEPGMNPKVVFTSGWPGGTQTGSTGVWYRGLQLDPRQMQWVSSNAVHPGDSGGPLLDETGRVLGVVSMGNDTGGRSPFSDNICIAHDPRPALRQRWLMDRPISLTEARQQAEQQGVSYSEVFEAMDVLAQVATKASPLPAGYVSAQFGFLQEAIRKAPANPGLHYLKGSLYQLLGDTESASESFEGALRADQKHFLSSVALGRNALARHRFSDAIDVFTPLLDVPPYRRVAIHGLIRSHMGRSEYGKARSFINDALDENPWDIWAFYWLGQYFVSVGDDVEAWQIIARLESRNPRWANALRQRLAHPETVPMDPAVFARARS